MKRYRFFQLLCALLLCSSYLQAQAFYNSEKFKQIDIEKKNYYNSSIDSAKAFISEWESRALESGDSLAIAYVWLVGNQICRISSHSQLAKEYGWKAQGIIDRHALKGKFTYNKRYLASVLGALGEYEEAIKLSLESIEEFNQEDPYQNQFNYHILASAYRAIGSYEIMDQYLQLWYDMVKEKGIRMDVGFAIYNMHEYYDIAGMYKEASRYQAEFYDFYLENAENLERVPDHAFINVKGENPEKTIEKLLKYLPHHLENKRSRNVAQTYRHLGDEYSQLNNPSKAITYYEKAENMNWAVSLSNQIAVYSALAQSYSLVGDFKKAFLSNQNGMSLKDSLQNLDIIRQANELKAKYESEKKDLELEVKEQQIHSKNNWLIFSGVTAILVFCFAGFIFSLNKKLKSSRKSLIKSLSEKETLLQEIHHRVKNNLQVVSSLLALQSKYVKDEKAVSALNEGQNRVESMALIHQNLYRDDNISGVDMKSYIPLLANNIFESYNILGDRIKIEYDIDDIALDVITVIPIGLVLNELISNALKYAFPNETSGLVKVSLKESQEKLILQVTDNGVGRDSTTNEPGFGTKLINSFSRKLEGVLNVTSHNGTEVELQIFNFKRA